MVVFSLKCDVCKRPLETPGFAIGYVFVPTETLARDTVKEARAYAADVGWTFVRGWDLCRACAGKQPAEAKET